MTAALSEPSDTAWSAWSARVLEFMKGQDYFGRRFLKEIHGRCLNPAAPQASEIHIAVFGRFSAGKSTFLNGLAGRQILPTHWLPMTAVVCRIRSGNNVVRYQVEGKSVALLLEANTLDTIVSHQANNDLQYVDIELSSQGFPAPRTCWLDCPGIDASTIDKKGKSALETSRLAEHEMVSADLLVWVFSSWQFLSLTELSWLEKALTAGGPERVVPVLNVQLPELTNDAWDQFLTDQWPEIRDYWYETTRVLGYEDRLSEPIAVCAKALLDPREEGFGCGAIRKRTSEITNRAGAARAGLLRTELARIRHELAQDLTLEENEYKADVLQHHHQEQAREEKNRKAAAGLKQQFASNIQAFRNSVSTLFRTVQDDFENNTATEDSLQERLYTDCREYGNVLHKIAFGSVISAGEKWGTKYNALTAEQEIKEAIPCCAVDVSYDKLEYKSNSVGKGMMAGFMIGNIVPGLGHFVGSAIGAAAGAINDGIQSSNANKENKTRQIAAMDTARVQLMSAADTAEQKLFRFAETVWENPESEPQPCGTAKMQSLEDLLVQVDAILGAK